MAESSIPSCGRWPRARCKTPRRWPAALAVIGGLLAVAAQPGSCQTVLGQLFDAATGAPVEGALVLLLDQAGEEAGGYLTNQAGRFIIQAPSPGTYTVRAERIGYGTTTSEPFRLGAGQRFGIRLETDQTAIELEELRVEGDQKCVVRPGEGVQLATIWEEARKALTVQDWTEREGTYRFQLSNYERELDRDARTVLSETRQVRTGVSRSPIQSLPAEDLLTEGFVRQSSERGYDYFGPDASVLLSDIFLDSHCFGLRLDPERPRVVGLSFEPVRRGSIADIEGTLWLDAETAELGTLEYRYTWSPWDEVQGIARGRVEFENLPNGAWVIRRWWIRMPLVRGNFIASPLAGTSRVVLTGIKEVGGEITRLASLDRSVVSELARGVLEGQVWDSTRFAPLAGATVFLSGTSYSAETDASGRFVMSGLPGGTFTAAFSHPRLDSLGAISAGVEVEITAGDFTNVNLGIPSAGTVMAQACREGELTDWPGVVIGVVRESGSADPVEGASVTVTWSTFVQRADGTFVERRDGFQVTSDSTGRYSLCGVPVDATLKIQATRGDQRSEEIQTHAAEGRATVVSLVIGG